MKIPHLTQTHLSKFYPLAKDALTKAAGKWPVLVTLGKPGGYNGEREVAITTAHEPEFESDFEADDWTRFPARIRAAATALRDAGFTSSFLISHKDGELRIAQTPK
jgi:hypothetical protein